MSDNELININQMTDEQIMKAIGQDDGTSSSDGIPRLSINRSPEDDDGNQIPVGNFSVFDTTIGKVAYGKIPSPKQHQVQDHFYIYHGH